MITLIDILDLGAHNCFIAIARNTSDYVCSLMRTGVTDVRRSIVGTVRQNHMILEETVEIYDPPRPQIPPHTGLVLARFQLEARMNNRDYQGNLRFDCRLVTGSPKENLQYTLILTQCHEC